MRARAGRRRAMPRPLGAAVRRRSDGRPRYPEGSGAAGCGKGCSVSKLVYWSWCVLWELALCTALVTCRGISDSRGVVLSASAVPRGRVCRQLVSHAVPPRDPILHIHHHHHLRLVHMHHHVSRAPPQRAYSCLPRPLHQVKAQLPMCSGSVQVWLNAAAGGLLNARRVALTLTHPAHCLRLPAAGWAPPRWPCWRHPAAPTACAARGPGESGLGGVVKATTWSRRLAPFYRKARRWSWQPR